VGSARRAAEAGGEGVDVDVVGRWTGADRGGRFAALEEPEAPVDDVRAFFRPLR
jgi:hypothetical protein